MSSKSDDSITRFFGKLRAGDAASVQPLWEHFFPRLVGLARKTLNDRPQLMADADDAAQSAFISFWKRTGHGDFSGELDRNDLWNILAVITVRKARKQIRREVAKKRGGGKVLNESSLAGIAGDAFRLDEEVQQLPTHEMDLRCEELLLLLDDELRDFALLRLLSYTSDEISSILRCTDRKVRRKLSLIRRKWQAEVGS
jgi:RNA polymerase sigma factor (sigma-70 family)